MATDPVHPDTHPTRIAQAARALQDQVRRNQTATRLEADPERIREHVESLTGTVMVLASMVEALAIRAGRAR